MVTTSLLGVCLSTFELYYELQLHVGCQNDKFNVYSFTLNISFPIGMYIKLWWKEIRPEEVDIYYGLNVGHSELRGCTNLKVLQLKVLDIRKFRVFFEISKLNEVNAIFIFFFTSCQLRFELFF